MTPHGVIITLIIMTKKNNEDDGDDDVKRIRKCEEDKGDNVIRREVKTDTEDGKDRAVRRCANVKVDEGGHDQRLRKFVSRAMTGYLFRTSG